MEAGVGGAQGDQGFPELRVPSAPRRLMDGLTWLFACEIAVNNDTVSHSYKSVYLLAGSERTVIIDTGHPRQWPAIDRQLDQALGGRPLDFVLPTHAEYIHSGNVPVLLDKYPAATAIGDLRGFRLYYPGYGHRMVNRFVGESIDLGGLRLELVRPILYDLPQTLWAYEPNLQVLFVSDGLAHEHHAPGQCGRTTGEYDVMPDVENYALYNDRAFYWARYCNASPYFRELERFLATHPTRLLCPSHATVITNPATVLPLAEEGMNRGAGVLA
jgi:flavorubredoxin